jgi:hypothetical protein
MRVSRLQKRVSRLTYKKGCAGKLALTVYRLRFFFLDMRMSSNMASEQTYDFIVVGGQYASLAARVASIAYCMIRRPGWMHPGDIPRQICQTPQRSST